jgi:hypothetical protein
VRWVRENWLSSVSITSKSVRLDTTVLRAASNARMAKSMISQHCSASSNPRVRARSVRATQ